MTLTTILIIGTVFVATLGGLIPLIGMLGEGKSYGNDLERYILSRYPQNVADVEKFTQDFNRIRDNKFL